MSEMIRVETESEVATSERPARVLVYEDDKLVAVVIAGIERQKGADGGFYPCVTLKNYGQPEMYDLLNAFLSKNPGSEQQLAREFDVSRPTITRWAHGITCPVDFIAKKIVIPHLKKLLQKQDN
ncbi:MAG: hypothetical protein HYV47_03590 [Candidatus Nealsonbacteria bacterium]|nr:hypothetical protein [Candidatus Nealsonbacteria bacterium]